MAAEIIKPWDSNVTKKFQEIHDQYKGYKDLGELEDLQQAVQYAQMMQDDPVNFIQLLVEAVREAGMEIPEFTQNTAPVGPTDGGIAPEIEQRFKQQETMLKGMFDQFQTFMSQYTEQQQMSQLDKVLKDMHTQHGDFNDDFFLLQLEKGKSPEEAIQEWNKLTEKFGNPTHKPAPVLPPTNGAVRNDQVDTSKLGKKDRIAFITQMMEANRD